jgi:uncharacterized damage-inducible protein DinB
MSSNITGSNGSNQQAWMRRAEVIWFQRCQGEAHARLPGLSDYPSVSLLDRVWSELELSRQHWLEGLREGDLLGDVEYLSVTRGVVESFPLWQTLLHLSNHTAHHRGEVAAALSSLGSHLRASTSSTICVFGETARGPDRRSAVALWHAWAHGYGR